MRAGKKTMFFRDTGVIAVLGKNKLAIYHTGALYQIKSGSRFNALKHMHVFFQNKNQQAGKDSDFLGI